MGYRTLFYIVFLLGFLVRAQSNDEKIALYELYQATDGKNWNSKWDITKPISTWKGVTIKNDKVIGLDLSKMNLNGRLPESFDFLENLQVLVLSDNKLSGKLPKGLHKLKSLKSIDLSNNNFEGGFPTFVLELKSIRKINFSRNKFSGGLPEAWAKLKKLEVLDIAFNNFHGSLPETIGRLKNLKKLALQYNNFSGDIPVGFENLRSLKILQIAENDFASFDALQGIKENQLFRFDMQDQLPEYRLVNAKYLRGYAELKFNDD